MLRTLSIIGLTQDDVAELTGYSPEYVRRIESPNGKKKSFTIEAVYVISIALGVDIADLFDEPK